MSKPGDPRLGDLLESSKSSNASRRVAILGYPCDLGVIRNSGRPGALRGPDVIRSRLPKLGPLVNPELNIDIRNLSLVDKGNVDIVDSLEENHVELTSRVKELLDEAFITIVVGGGNDQSYCNAKALMNSLGSGYIGVVNIDAHFDVRPLLDGKLAHSGSPFRQLLLDDVFRKDGGKFYEFAAQGHQSSAEHAQFVNDNNGEIVWLKRLRTNQEVEKLFQLVLNSFGDRDVFVSFDIDSIQGADCPGVSCPAVTGISAYDAFTICFLAGSHPKTKLLDLSEFNPDIEEYRTGTLVCNMIYYFLMGVASREK